MGRWSIQINSHHSPPSFETRTGTSWNSIQISIYGTKKGRKVMTSDRWFVNSYILKVQPELGFPHSWCLYSVMNWDQKLNNRVNIEVLHGEQIWIQLMTCETWFGEDHEYKALLAWLRIVLPCHGIRPTGQWSYGLQLHRQVSVIWKVFVHVSRAYYKGAILGFNADWLWWTTSHTFCFLILIKMCVYKRNAVPGSPGRFRWF